MKTAPNTYRKGKLTFIFYKTKDSTYIAACDELCVLVEEKDEELAQLKVLAKSKFYLESVIGDKLGEHLLNQSLPMEIRKDFIRHLKKVKAEDLKKEEAGRWTTTISDLLKRRNQLCSV